MQEASSALSCSGSRRLGSSAVFRLRMLASMSFSLQCSKQNFKTR